MIKGSRKKAAKPEALDIGKIADGAAAGVIETQNRYDAGGTGRRMRGWTPPTAGPNRSIVQIQKLRDRARDAARNDWTGTAGLQHWTTNLIGTGIVPRAKRITNQTKKKKYADLWAKWTKLADSDGVLCFYGQQTLATRAWLESGEVFGRLRTMPEGSMEVPFKVQLLEADYVPMLDADSWVGMPVGNILRSGVEFDPLGQRVAYWAFKSHPSDYLGLTITSAVLARIPADEMVHVFEPKRPGQIRGVPEFSPVLARLRNVADFDDAVLERQKLANLFTAFVKQVYPANWDGTDPMTGKPIQFDKHGVPMAALEPGTTQELLAGEEVVFSNPPEAGTTYSEFMRGQNIGTAAGQGLPYELMSGDIANISDRTLRIVVNEFRRYAEQRQWQIIIPMLCQKVRERWVDIAAVVGLIDAADIDDMKLVEWSPHGWDYIHPIQDVQGKQLAVDAGFKSRSSVISSQGDDPDEVDNERKVDQDREDKLGLTPATLEPSTRLPPGEKKVPPTPGGPAPGAPPAAPGQPAPKPGKTAPGRAAPTKANAQDFETALKAAITLIVEALHNG
jgi:lambda family phage portal protein